MPYSTRASWAFWRVCQASAESWVMSSSSLASTAGRVVGWLAAGRVVGATCAEAALARITATKVAAHLIDISGSYRLSIGHGQGYLPMPSTAPLVGVNPPVIAIYESRRAG